MDVVSAVAVRDEERSDEDEIRKGREREDDEEEEAKRQGMQKTSGD